MEITLILGVVGVAIGLVRLALWWWGYKRLRTLQDWQTAFKAVAHAMADALRGTYKRIDAEPPSEKPADDLTDAWNRKPKP
jgi:hypothetical protein